MKRIRHNSRNIDAFDIMEYFWRAYLRVQMNWVPLNGFTSLHSSSRHIWPNVGHLQCSSIQVYSVITSIFWTSNLHLSKKILSSLRWKSLLHLCGLSSFSKFNLFVLSLFLQKDNEDDLYGPKHICVRKELVRYVYGKLSFRESINRHCRN